MNQSMHYAGFWRRVLAAIIDQVLILALVFAVLLPLSYVGLAVGGGKGKMPASALFLVLFYLLPTIGGWLYFALMESSSWQATLGKRAIGIKVTDEMGGRVSFGKATGRHFGKFLSSLIFSIGFLMAAFTERKQCLHDIIASTLVVVKN